MQMKKIIATVAAAALAVSAMAVSAFAANPTGTVTYTYTMSGADALAADLSAEGFYNQVQMGAASFIDDLTITYTNKNDATDTGYMLIATNWDGDAPVECKNFKWESTFESWTGAGLTSPDNKITADNAADYDFTVTMVFDCDAHADDFAAYTTKYPENEDATTMLIFTFMTKAASPYQVFVSDLPVAGDAAIGDGATVGDTDAAGTADKGNADTGVEGVAVVAGLAIVAAGAIVVAKKRK